MTRNDDPTRPDAEPTDRPMADVSHTHPYADEGALDRLFERGPVVAADGGQRDAYDPEDEGTADPDADDPARERGADASEDADEREASGEEGDGTPMKDVDHTPPHGDGVDRVFERGGEHERVESEE